MKYIGSLIFALSLLLNNSLLYSQCIQPGTVLEYKGKETKTPVSLAEIIVKGASPATTDNNGKFKLNFFRLKPGDKITNPFINKSGFVIFNKEALEQWTISSSDEEFVIILCDKNHFDELFRKYHNIGSESYKKDYEAAISKISSLLQEKKITEEEFSNQYEKLLNDYQQSLTMLNNYIDFFVRIDEENLNELQKKALSFIKEGNIDEAIKIYESAELLKEYDKASKRVAVGKTIVESGLNDMRNIESNIIAYIQTCKLKGGEENYRKAGEALKQLALTDSTDLTKTINYAQFSLDQRNYSEAELFYRKVLDVRLDNAQKVEILNKIGEIYLNNTKYNEAKEYLHQAMDLYKTLAEDQKTQKFKVSLEIQINLGKVYYSNSEYEYGVDVFTDLIRQLKKINQLSGDTLEVKSKLVWSLRGRGLIENSLKEYEKAEQDLLDAISLTTELISLDSIKFMSLHANILNCLGIVYQNNNNAEKAENLYLEAIQIGTKQRDNNPSAFSYDLTMPLVNYNTLLYNSKRYNDAKSSLIDQLKENRRLFKENPTAFNQTYLIALSTLAKLSDKTGNYEEAIRFTLEKMESYKILDSLLIKNAKSNIAWCKYLLSYYYSKNKQFDLAIGACNSSIEQFQSLQYPENILKGYEQLVNIFMTTENYQNALIVMDSIDVLRENELYKKQFLEKDTSYLFLRALLYYNNGEKKESESILNKLIHVEGSVTDYYKKNYALYFLIALKLENKELSDVIPLLKQQWDNLQNIKDKQTIDFKKTLADYYDNYGKYYETLNDYPNALIQYQNAVNLHRQVKKAEQEEFCINVSFSLWKIGYIYQLQEKYQMAVDTLKLALIELEKVEQEDFSQTSEVAKLTNTIGYSLNKIGNFEEAEFYYLASIKRYKLVDSLTNKKCTKELAEVLTNTGQNNNVLSYQKKQQDNSKKYYQESLTYYLKLPESEVKNCSSELGSLYFELALKTDSIERESNFKKSLEYLQQVSKADSSVAVRGMLGTVLSLYGSYYFTSGQFDKADTLLVHANEVFNKNNEKAVVQWIDDMLVTIRMKQKRYNEALFYSIESLKFYADTVYADKNDDEILRNMVLTNDTILQNINFSNNEASDVLTQLADIYNRVNYKDKAFNYYKTAYSYLSKTNNASEENLNNKVYLSHILGNHYFQNALYDSAVIFLSDCNKLYNSHYVHADSVQIAYDSYNLGTSYRYLGKNEDAFENYFQAIRIFNELNTKIKGKYSNILAEIKLNKADILYMKGNIIEAKSEYETALSFYLLQQNSPNYDNIWMSGHVYDRLSLCTSNNMEKLKYLEKALQQKLIVFKEYENEATIPDMISSYGNLSCYYLFVKEFPKAEESARNGIDLAHKHQMDSTALWINTNLAHALLFQGKFEEARTIYLQYKDQPYPQEPEKTFRELFLKDFDELEKAGMMHPDVAKIRELLNE